MGVICREEKKSEMTRSWSRMAHFVGPQIRAFYFSSLLATVSVDPRLSSGYIGASSSRMTSRDIRNTMLAL